MANVAQRIEHILDKSIHPIGRKSALAACHAVGQDDIGCDAKFIWTYLESVRGVWSSWLNRYDAASCLDDLVCVYIHL